MGWLVSMAKFIISNFKILLCLWADFFPLLESRYLPIRPVNITTVE